MTAWTKVPCWQWPGSLCPNGYPILSTRKGTRRVQRIIYAAIHGPIPPGLVIDHLCRNRGCFNPRHLEAVTNKVNVLRGNGHTAINARKTHCNNGHPLVGDNLERIPYGRSCRTCAKRRRRVWDHKSLALAASQEETPHA